MDYSTKSLKKKKKMEMSQLTPKSGSIIFHKKGIKWKVQQTSIVLGNYQIFNLFLNKVIMQSILKTLMMKSSHS